MGIPVEGEAEQSPHRHEEASGNAGPFPAQAIHTAADDQTAQGPAQTHGKHGIAHHHGGPGHGPLEEKRCIGKEGEHGKTGHHHQEIAQSKAGVFKKFKIYEGILGPALHPDKADAQQNRCRHQKDPKTRAPGHLPPPGHDQGETGQDRPGEAGKPGPIQIGPAPLFPEFLEKNANAGQGKQSQGQVDIENPGPGKIGNDESPQGGADDRGNPPDRAGQRKGFPPAAGQGHIGKDHIDQGEDPPGPDALENPGPHQKAHGGGKAGGQGGAGKKNNGNQHQDLGGKQIRKLTKDRQGNGPGQEIGGIDPGVEGKAAQFRNDGGHGRRHDQGIQGSQKQCQKG